MVVVLYISGRVQPLCSTPKGISPWTMYQVFVNGAEAPVYNSPMPVSFYSDISGPVEVVICHPQRLEMGGCKATARVSAVWHGNEIRFKWQKPVQLSVELNGKLNHPFFLFANAPEENKSRPFDKGVYCFEVGKLQPNALTYGPLYAQKSIYN